MVLDKMVAVLFKTECHWKTRQWKTELRATIEIPNVFIIRALDIPDFSVYGIPMVRSFEYEQLICAFQVRF